MSDTKSALNYLCEAIVNAGYKLYDEISLGMDCASNYFYDKSIDKYVLNSRNKSGKKEGVYKYDTQQMIDYYKFFLEHYPIIYLEDYFNEDSFDDFASLSNDKSVQKIAFTGDDLITTNSKRLETAIQKKSVNTIIVKPNQIGTVYETFDVVNMCIENNIMYVPSHRSADTTDSIITDIAVGLGAKFLKAGSVQRGERTAKYNRLMEISDMLYV